MMALRFLFSLLFGAGALQSAVLAQSPESPNGAATTDQKELVAMLEAYDELESSAEGEHAAEYLPKFLSFETRHRGSFAGLMALRFILEKATDSVGIDNPWASGSSEVAKRLQRYGRRAELPSLLRRFCHGGFEPSVEAHLRSLAADEGATAANRTLARLTLAHWMLAWRSAREVIELRLQELESGAEPHFVSERSQYQALLDTLPPWPQLKAWQEEAHEILGRIASSDRRHRQPVFENLDARGYLIRLDEDRTSTQPRLSETARGLLFQESLRPGNPAPDLEVELISGKSWSLAEQRGELVIIQFSYKGCGPCEALYPVLRDIQQTHGQRVSILSIMADRKRPDTEQAVAAGKLTWDVCWDGWQGPIATRWAVNGFPEVYIFGPQGKVVAANLGGERLKRKVHAVLAN